MSAVKERNHGIDILRVLSMLCIICLHVLNNGGGLVDSQNLDVTSAILRFFISIAYCSVNVFAMITGYLYIQRSSVKCSNLVKLIVTMFFYCIIATALFFVFKRDAFSDLKTILYSVFPPIAGKYWYFVCYTLVFLLIPSLNKFVSVISKKQYSSLIVMLFVLFSVISTVGLNDYFRINTGYSPFWLIFCYLVGGYVKLYTNENENRKRGWIYLSLFLAINMLVVGIWAVTVILFNKPLGFETVVGYVSPLTVCNAVLVLLLFSGIRVKNNVVKKIVLSLSGGAFDVYMIHCQMLVMAVFIENKFNFVATLSPIYAIAVLLGVMAGIYLICYVVYLIKDLIFKVVLINRFCDFVGKKLDHVLPLNGFEQKNMH